MVIAVTITRSLCKNHSVNEAYQKSNKSTTILVHPNNQEPRYVMQYPSVQTVATETPSLNIKTEGFLNLQKNLQFFLELQTEGTKMENKYHRRREETVYHDLEDQYPNANLSSKTNLSRKVG